MNIYIKYFVLILVISFFNNAMAQKVKYDGFVELGAKYEYDDLYVESFYDAKLEFKLKLNDRIKIELDLRADSDEQQIVLREASVDYDFSEELRISIGALKKRFGREELVSREKLHTIQRSMINRFLSPLGFVSRDPGIQVRWENDSQEIIGGVNYNASHNLTLMSRYTAKDISVFQNIGGSLHFVKHLNQQGLEHSYAASLDFSKQIGRLTTELELFYGSDPIETGYKKMFGLDENVNFIAAKILSTCKFYLDNKFLTGIEPILLAGFLSPDTDYMDVNKLELLFGVNIYIDEYIRFMINGDLILSNNILNKSERSLTESNVIAQFQISW